MTTRLGLAEIVEERISQFKATVPISEPGLELLIQAAVKLDRLPLLRALIYTPSFLENSGYERYCSSF